MRLHFRKEWLFAAFAVILAGMVVTQQIEIHRLGTAEKPLSPVGRFQFHLAENGAVLYRFDTQSGKTWHAFASAPMWLEFKELVELYGPPDKQTSGDIWGTPKECPPPGTRPKLNLDIYGPQYGDPAQPARK